ncbi:MAG: hypothetical protein ABIT83_06910 [Massilia sp.]
MKKSASVLNWTILGIAVVGILYVNISDSVKKEAALSCGLIAPPSTARKVETHGASLRVYPVRIPSGFNGCERAWFADGKLLVSTEYRKGRIYKIDDHAPNRAAATCVFDGDKVKGGPPERCAALLNSLSAMR